MEELCPAAHIVFADVGAAVVAAPGQGELQTGAANGKGDQGPHPKGADCPGGRNWGLFPQLQPQEVCDGHGGQHQVTIMGPAFG